MKELLDYSPLQRVSFARPLNILDVANILTFDVDIPVFEFERQGRKYYAFGCLVDGQQALIYPKSFFQPYIYRDESPRARTNAMKQVAACNTLGDLRKLLSDRSILILATEKVETQFGLRKYPIFDWTE